MVMKRLAPTMGRLDVVTAEVRPTDLVPARRDLLEVAVTIG